MKTAIAKLKSASPYSQSRYHGSEKIDKEGADEYEKRTWIEKGHFDEHGEMFIPPIALKFCLESAAKELGLQVPGRGKKTYGAAFKNGIMVLDPIKLGVKRDEVKPHWIPANADGVRGSGKRVLRAFPQIPAWTGTVTFHILNDMIKKDVFVKHLTEAGRYIGIGQFRPQNGGYNGRFEVVDFEWKED